MRHPSPDPTTIPEQECASTGIPEGVLPGVASCKGGMLLLLLSDAGAASAT